MDMTNDSNETNDDYTETTDNQVQPTTETVHKTVINPLDRHRTRRDKSLRFSDHDSRDDGGQLQSQAHYP